MRPRKRQQRLQQKQNVQQRQLKSKHRKKKRLRQRNVWRRAWSALREPSSATTALKEQIAPKERTVPITETPETETPETETETDPVTTVITETETDLATTVTTEMETDLATTVTTETETDPVTTVITETVTETSPAAEMVRVRKGHPVMEQEETRTVRVITAVQEIIRAIIALQAVAALVRAITVLVQMADALRTAMDGRTIDSAGKGFAAEAPAKDTEKRRDDRRLNQQERDKKSRRDAIYEEDGAAALKNAKKAGRFIKPEPKPVEPEETIKVITVGDNITIKELAEKMKMQPAAIIKKLFLEGKIVTVNQEISYEDAENIAIDYDIICEKEVKVDVIEELLKEDEEADEDMVSRPPVICVMGHVDHGKTSLLDAIRKTNVTDREAGGITQHIGAYTVQINGQAITFLDTPGHEAFTAMRMRGANATDIAVLVVAADDGVMPQTVEAINHAKAAGIEIIVAVNKIDKPNANVDRVKQELTEYELVAEDWGGSTVFVPVSAKTGEGIQQLLEMILLTAEVMELKANPNRMARGIVLEAQLDKGRGPVASVLVQKGTLHVGDFVSAGSSSGKVRAMIDDKGRRVKEAGPSMPVEILGLSDVPEAGDVFLAHESDKEAKSYAEAFIEQNKEKKLEETKSRMSLDDLVNQIQEGNLKELNLIVKADVQGSVEAVKQSLTKLSNEEIVVKCIHGGVGAINESDVTLASASNAIIIGFNVRPDATAKATAETEGVDIRLYKVIYQAIEDVEAAMKGMLDPVYEEKIIGHAEVRQIFKASAIGNIAGSYVLDGVFTRGCKVRITREGELIYEGALASLKRFKDDVKEVKAGFECGLVFEGFDKMKEFDVVEAYIMVEVPR